LLLLAEEEADPQRPGHGRQEGRHPVDRHHLLKALLAKNKIDEKAVTIVPIGADMTPLMTGQVDAVTGWLTNTTALKVLGAERVDMALWDTGVKLYALPYYATTKTCRRAAMRSPASCARRRRAGNGPTRTVTPPSTCWSRSTRTSIAPTNASPPT
jgi:hypothetical protein